MYKVGDIDHKLSCLFSWYIYSLDIPSWSVTADPNHAESCLA